MSVQRTHRNNKSKSGSEMKAQQGINYTLFQIKSGHDRHHIEQEGSCQLGQSSEIWMGNEKKCSLFLYLCALLTHSDDESIKMCLKLSPRF